MRQRSSIVRRTHLGFGQRLRPWHLAARLDVELSILTVCHRLSACREDLLNHRLGEDFLGGSKRDAVDPSAESLGGAEGIADMIRRYVDAYGLERVRSVRRASKNQKEQAPMQNADLLESLGDKLSRKM